MAMTENARKKLEKAERRTNKEPARKKKKGNAGEKLKTALVQDAKVRAGSKPIFVQPPNLADGCYLKDYQLEGVRWLASLFENGVSGILADEVRVDHSCLATWIDEWPTSFMTPTCSSHTYLMTSLP